MLRGAPPTGLFGAAAIGLAGAGATGLAGAGATGLAGAAIGLAGANAIGGALGLCATGGGEAPALDGSYSNPGSSNTPVGPVPPETATPILLPGKYTNSRFGVPNFALK